jgi:hypothetical protein
MKLYVIPFLMLAMSCEAQPQETVKYGTFFAISNNTFGVNDFKVGEVGSYPVCFGAMDFGRNLYRKSSNPVDYSDVIGVIKFEQAGTGYVEPLAAFNYTQVGPSTWKYSEYMSKYSGNYMWIGNKLQFDSKQGL